MKNWIAIVYLALSGCATDGQGLTAWLAPFCVFNCVISVTYAPGVEELKKSESSNVGK